jgi:hypothetical protein
MALRVELGVTLAQLRRLPAGQVAVFVPLLLDFAHEHLHAPISQPAHSSVSGMQPNSQPSKTMRPLGHAMLVVAEADEILSFMDSSYVSLSSVTVTGFWRAPAPPKTDTKSHALSMWAGLYSGCPSRQHASEQHSCLPRILSDSGFP